MTAAVARLEDARRRRHDQCGVVRDPAGWRVSCSCGTRSFRRRWLLLAVRDWRAHRRRAARIR